MTFVDRFIAKVTRRPPDFIIGGAENPYIRRWWVIPRNRFFNIYLHHFLRSDDDRALHDHPWASCSILLQGSYVEHTIAAGGINVRKLFAAGDWRIRWSGRLAHRIELLRRAGHELPCWTLFITGPRYREWGFHCESRWVPWQKFVSVGDSGSVGPGCDAEDAP
jgi:hypothetical protein